MTGHGAGPETSSATRDTTGNPTRGAAGRRKRPWILVAAVVGLALVVTVALLSRRPPPGRSAPSPGEHSVVDMASRTVALPRAPSRVLSLCTSATDTMVALGLADRLRAVDEYSHALPGAEKAEVVGRGSAVSRERIAALGIDLAFIWWYQDEVADLLARQSIPVVRLHASRAREVPAMMRLVATCLGTGAEPLAGPVERFERSARDAAPGMGASVYVEMYGPFKTMGRDTYTDDLVAMAGGRNVARDGTGSVLLSAERLLASNPDAVILLRGFTSEGDFRSRPGLSSLAAVHNGRIHVLDRHLLVAGPRMMTAVATLREILDGRNQASSSRGAGHP